MESPPFIMQLADPVDFDTILKMMKQKNYDKDTIRKIETYTEKACKKVNSVHPLPIHLLDGYCGMGHPGEHDMERLELLWNGVFKDVPFEALKFIQSLNDKERKDLYLISLDEKRKGIISLIEAEKKGLVDSDQIKERDLYLFQFSNAFLSLLEYFIRYIIRKDEVDELLASHISILLMIYGNFLIAAFENVIETEIILEALSRLSVDLSFTDQRISRKFHSIYSTTDISNVGINDDV